MTKTASGQEFRTPSWQRFGTDCKVVVVAGGMPFEHRDTEDDFNRYSDLLQKWGLNRKQLEIFRTENDYYGKSDTPQKRAEFIVKTLADPQVKLMFDGGGNGTDEVIEYLKRYEKEGRLTMRPDVVMCGVSDGDQLLNYLGSIGAVSPVQSLPLGALTRDPKCAERMHKFLFEQEIEDVGLQCFNNAAQGLQELEGKLVIFNGHSRRAEYSTVIDDGYGSILLLEATQQASRRNVVEGLRFALDSMEKQGQRPRAILLSQSDLLHSLEQVAEIRRIAEESAIPIFSGAPFGHAKSIDAVPLPLHTDVKITISGDSATLNISPARTAEDVEAVKEVCRSRTPYSISPAPIADETISIPDIIVACVHGKSGEGKKSQTGRGALISREDRRSWVDVVKGVTEVTDSKEFLFARATRICQRCEATDLDCVDLSGKNVMIGFEGMPSFQDWQDDERKKDPNIVLTEKNYNKHCLVTNVQDTQTILMELLKTGQLQQASSLIFLSRREIPKGFDEWLKDFAEGHDLSPSFFVGKAPQDTELFPKGIPQSKGSVELVETRMKVVERLREESKSTSVTQHK